MIRAQVRLVTLLLFPFSGMQPVVKTLQVSREVPLHCPIAPNCWGLGCGASTVSRCVSHGEPSGKTMGPDQVRGIKRNHACIQKESLLDTLFAGSLGRPRNPLSSAADLAEDRAAIRGSVRRLVPIAAYTRLVTQTQVLTPYRFRAIAESSLEALPVAGPADISHTPALKPSVTGSAALLYVGGCQEAGLQDGSSFCSFLRCLLDSFSMSSYSPTKEARPRPAKLDFFIPGKGVNARKLQHTHCMYKLQPWKAVLWKVL